MVVGFDASKPQRLIQSNRLLHRGQGIQAHAFITTITCCINNRSRQRPPNTPPSESGSHIKPFHFACVLPDFSQCNAARNFGARQREQQTSLRRPISARQRGQFLIESLETEVYVNSLRIFPEQPPHRRDLPLRTRLCDSHRLLWARCYWHNHPIIQSVKTCKEKSARHVMCQRRRNAVPGQCHQDLKIIPKGFLTIAQSRSGGIG